jgi:hypothetical protein
MEASSAQLAGVVRFGVFELDVRSGELRKSGVRVNLLVAGRASERGDPDQSNGLYLIPVELGEPRPLTRARAPANDAWPAFSPAARHLAYASCRDEGYRSNCHVLALDLDSRGAPRLQGVCRWRGRLPRRARRRAQRAQPRSRHHDLRCRVQHPLRRSRRGFALVQGARQRRLNRGLVAESWFEVMGMASDGFRSRTGCTPHIDRALRHAQSQA